MAVVMMNECCQGIDALFEPLMLQWDEEEFVAAEAVRVFSVAIGEGENQMADYVATLVNGGNRYKLHLVNKITDADGTVLQETKPEILSKTGFKQENVDAVKAGMMGVVASSASVD